MRGRISLGTRDLRISRPTAPVYHQGQTDRHAQATRDVCQHFENHPAPTTANCGQSAAWLMVLIRPVGMSRTIARYCPEILRESDANSGTSGNLAQTRCARLIFDPELQILNSRPIIRETFCYCSG